MATLIGSLILLRDTMAALPRLAGALDGAHATLLATLAATFGHATFGDTLRVVDAVLDEARLPTPICRGSFGDHKYVLCHRH